MSEGFLNRWSRLKRSESDASLDRSEASQADLKDKKHFETVSEKDLTNDEPETLTSASAEELVEDDLNQEEPLLSDEDMPDLTTIHAGSDMSMFFSKGVSASLRRQALRKFFHQPEFNVRDPLDDYALDYSQPKKLVLDVGDKVRGWAQQQMDDAMQQAKDALLETSDSSVEKESSLDASDTTKVDESHQDGKNESA